MTPSLSNHALGLRTLLAREYASRHGCPAEPLCRLAAVLRYA